MNSPNHFESLLVRHAWILVPVVCISLMYAWNQIVRLPQQSAGTLEEPVSVIVGTTIPGGANWAPFVTKDDKTASGGSALRERFRLAGVFSAHAERGAQRCAVLDDRQTGAQRIVSENAILPDDVTVRQVGSDSVLLSRFGVEERLTLGGDASGHGAAGSNGVSQAKVVAAADLPVEGGVNMFGGRQVSGNRWVFNRQKLLEYYGQLRDEPERLVKVFDSMKPVYTPDRKISGYRLKAEGERAFFDAVGLREGDVIRSVNSMKMTSRRRAEMMIRDFVEKQSSVFVFEVERDGKPQTQIYSVP